MWEMGKYSRSMFYDVLKWHGGFHISLNDTVNHENKAASIEIVVNSFNRCWGGSEMRHVIDSEGNVTDKSGEVTDL